MDTDSLSQSSGHQGWEPGQEALQPQSLIHTRCPSCLKLFAIDPLDLKAGSATFECSACQAQFAIEAVSPGSDEAQSRLIAPSPSAQAKAEPELDPNQIANEIALGAKPELIMLWKKIIDDYEDEFLHEGFIQACFNANALGYAGAKYGRILSEFPAEPIALKMRKKVQALGSVQIDAANAARNKESVSAKAQPPTARMPSPVLSLTSVALLLGTILTLIGMTIPGQKNLSAIGIAMLALVIGVRFVYQRNNSSKI